MRESQWRHLDSSFLVFGQPVFAQDSKLIAQGCRKMLGDGNYIALNNKAPHPTQENRSSTILDEESMKIMANMGEFVIVKASVHRYPEPPKSIRADGQL